MTGIIVITLMITFLVLLILLSIFLIAFFRVRFFVDKRSKPDVKLTKNIMNIFKKNTKRGGTCEILTDKFGSLIDTNNKVVYEDIKEDERVIFVCESGSFSKNLETVEIYSVFESYLFLERNELPYHVIAIVCEYTNGGLDNYTENLTVIRISEFQELYKNTDLTGLNNSELAKKLAEKWIQQTGYLKK